MNKNLIIIWFGFIINCVNAQTHTESFVACSKSYTAICDLQNDNSIKITIKDGLDTNYHITYNITTADIDVFARSFKLSFEKLGGIGTCAASTDTTEAIVSLGRRLFLNYYASLTDTTSKVAGIIKVSDRLGVHLRYKIFFNGKDSTIDLKNREDGFDSKVNKVQIEISEGYITNLKAYVDFNRKIYQFILPFGIGISSVGNFRNHRDTRLYEINSPVYFGHLTKFQKEILRGNQNAKLDSAVYIFLSDLLNYDYDLQVDRRDYSPRNQKVTLLGGESKLLYKEQTNRLFEAHIFTDFIGLNEEKPNGLIQTQVSKRININSVQRIAPPFLYGLIKSVGIFQYITPNVTFSKIEQHNKRLTLGDLDSIRYNPGFTDTSKFTRNLHRYVSALDLYQYESFSAGLDWNILFLNNNDLKYSFDINFGGKLGITEVADSLTSISNNLISKTKSVNNYSINTIQLYPEIKLTLLPEERFNLSISDRLIYFKPLNSRVQVLEFDNNNNSRVYAKNATWINSFQMLMTIQTNPNSKLFGKIRFNSEWQNTKSNFAQVQVGYSTYILGRK